MVKADNEKSLFDRVLFEMICFNWCLFLDFLGQALSLLLSLKECIADCISVKAEPSLAPALELHAQMQFMQTTSDITAIASCSSLWFLMARIGVANVFFSQQL